ncbi:MAG: HAMP domain-containing sensor histidine kinase [Actinomycetota bacterium]
MIAAPRWTQSIRFRLSLFYALALFVTGSLLIGGLYIWQVERLDEPQLRTSQVQMVDPRTSQPVTFNVRSFGDVVDAVEYNAYLRTLDNLKSGSYGALAVLFVFSFGASWWVAGLALRPVHRMTNVARDITASNLSRRISLPGPDDELKGLADTFDAMLDRLETGFEDQRRFVQDASHELRNPLAVARTNLELALSDPDATPEELRASAEVASRSAERMSRMVEELLAQARSGVPELAIDEVDLAVLAGEMAEEYRATARQRKVSIELNAPAAVLTRGDGSVLRRAIGNLLSNAIKASPQGSTVTITAAALDHNQALVSVSDRGPGLTDDEQLQVFDRFWKGATSNGGSGLGLSIVRHVVERHGGEVSVASEPGLGSTFSIRLPRGTSGPRHPRTTSGSRGDTSEVG